MQFFSSKSSKIIAEANAAFALNRDVIHSLEPEVKAAIGDQIRQKNLFINPNQD